MGFIGFCCAFGLQYWTSAVDWPLIIGGKPFNSWPAFVPVMFELTVLFAGVSTVLALFAVCGLPAIQQKAFDPAITRDKFALVIEDSDKEKEASRFLSKVGAKNVRSVYSEGWF